jgi:dCTP deaminase
MVLSDAGLRRARADGELDIEPFSEKSLTPNGYDLSSGSVLVPSTGQRTGKGAAPVPPKCWFVIGTVERVRLGRGLAGQLWLRSSFARKGILATFGKIDAGFDGALTVSAFNASESVFEMPLGERFCQMVVERLDAPAEKEYAERSGRFQHQTGITLEATEEKAAGPQASEARLCEDDRGSSGSGEQGAVGNPMEGPMPKTDELPCRKNG